MTTKTYAMMDGNEATARIAHKVNEVIAIYPITPSSTMGEHADAFSAAGMTNIWGTVPSVYEMQSEGGAVGAVHGSLATGALTTTFTASQGLLLMIPNMYKIAGELTPTVFHVTARSIACQGLSIFGDHGDVMACRQTGFAMLSSNSVQEAHDFALIAQAATLEARVPFMHFFDGFRTSHEVNKIETIDDETIRAMIDDDLVMAHRARGLNPEKPTIRGTAQNPDVYFQGRETVNPYYLKTPEIVQKAMDKLGGMTGRNYKIYEYVGAPDADRIIVIMGSGAETVHEVAEYLNAKGEKVGLVKVRLFRPFSAKDFIKAFPKTTKKVAVMDRTKEPGAAGEPLYIDVRNSIGEAMEEGLAPFSSWPKVVGGRYGLGSKDFTPDQVIAIYDNLKADKPKNHFTVGIIDDVCNTSLPMGEVIETGDPTTFSAMFYGMGSDGTVGANKDSIKVIGTNAKDYAQGYFVYDSKKSGSMTISHLRFGDKPLHCPYLISHADFVACHNFSFIEKYNMVKPLKKGGNFLLETEYSADEVWEHLPVETQEELIKKQAKLYVIDANKLAREIGLGGRINIIMQTCFFKISEDKIMPEEKFKELQKKAVKKTYGKKGDEVVKMNCDAIDKALENLHEVKIPAKATSTEHIKKSMHVEEAPAEIKELVSGVLEPILAGNGDAIKVSQMPDDGTYPTGTSQLEKRNVGLDIPVWNPESCAQCGYVAELKKLIGGCDCKCETGKRLAKVADYLIKRSVWVIGGDGWAYDIGYGGLDHVLASGKNIKVLVLDTEVYSNTGGQMSKATPIGAVAKFADSGKTMAKKDLGMIAMTYENIYVGKISLGGDMNHALKTMNEAEAYDGPALIIAYAHCINHGINMTKGLDEQKLAVQTGHWPLYRFNPELRAQGKNPLTVDYKEPTDNETINFRTFAGNENRFKQLLRKNPEGAKVLFDKAQQNVKLKYALYKQIADIKL